MNWNGHISPPFNKISYRLFCYLYIYMENNADEFQRRFDIFYPFIEKIYKDEFLKHHAKKTKSKASTKSKMRQKSNKTRRSNRHKMSRVDKLIVYSTAEYLSRLYENLNDFLKGKKSKHILTFKTQLVMTSELDNLVLGGGDAFALKWKGISGIIATVIFFLFACNNFKGQLEYDTNRIIAHLETIDDATNQHKPWFNRGIKEIEFLSETFDDENTTLTQFVAIAPPEMKELFYQNATDTPTDIVVYEPVQNTADTDTLIEIHNIIDQLKNDDNNVFTVVNLLDHLKSHLENETNNALAKLNNVQIFFNRVTNHITKIKRRITDSTTEQKLDDIMTTISSYIFTKATGADTVMEKQLDSIRLLVTQIIPAATSEAMLNYQAIVTSLDEIRKIGTSYPNRIGRIAKGWWLCYIATLLTIACINTIYKIAKYIFVSTVQKGVDYYIESKRIKEVGEKTRTLFEAKITEPNLSRYTAQIKALIQGFINKKKSLKNLLVEMKKIAEIDVDNDDLTELSNELKQNIENIEYVIHNPSLDKVTAKSVEKSVLNAIGQSDKLKSALLSLHQ